MQIKIWGCRGSIPSPGPETVKYGGETTCVEVRTGGQRLIIDAGSGIRKLGEAMLAEGREGEATLLLTHMHWDHLAGFPFFRPAYMPGFRFRLCGGGKRNDSLLRYLAHQMDAPYFPVPFTVLRASFSEEFRCGDASCGNILSGASGVECESVPLNHPNGGYGFRFTENGKSFVFLTDNEIGFSHPDGVPEEVYLDFCHGADLLIHDAQYTDEEYGLTRGWGHSTYANAVDFALKAGVRRLGLFHHDPGRTDDQLDTIVAMCRERIALQGGGPECFACADGMEFSVGALQ